MTNINISKRLKSIARMVQKGSIVADVGCDHALLDIYLINEKQIKRAIAIDVTKGAINQAINNINKYNVKKIDARLGDGLNPVKKEDNIDTIILSGLGNQKIISILNENKEKLLNIRYLIIQSNTKIENIRKEVIKLGYYIKNEEQIKEKNIIYTIISFEKGYKKYTKKEILLGPILLQNKTNTFNEYVKNIINSNNAIIKRLPNSKIIKKFKLKLFNYILKKEIQK